MALKNKYEFIMLFDVENGNPNGDPDAGNTPRIDPETGIGIVTDVCIKRKIRNYVELIKEDEEGFEILYKADRGLEDKFKEALKSSKNKDAKAIKNKEVRDYLCKRYFDARVFGTVIAINGEGNNHVTGPVQINFAKSISPIFYRELTITRQARDKTSELEKNDTTMGKKSIVPDALYRAEGYVSAALANKVTDLSEEDLELLWSAIINMFEEDHSAARGKMCMRKLIVFKHENILGNCPSHLLFDKVKVEEIAYPPRKYSDYKITVDTDIPNGVELIEKI